MNNGLDAKTARELKVLLLSSNGKGTSIATPRDLDDATLASLRERFGASVEVKPITETEFFRSFEEQYAITGVPSLEYARAVKHRAIVIDIQGSEAVIASPLPFDTYEKDIAALLRMDKLHHHPISEAGFQALLDATYPRPYGGTTFEFSPTGATNGAVGDNPKSYLDTLLEIAVSEHITDIHLEIALDGMGRIRMRRDRFLYDAYTRYISGGELQALVRVARSSAKAQPEDKLANPSWRVRLPSGRDADMRLQFIPTIRGEELAIRLMGTGTRHFSIDTLGLSPAMLQLYMMLLAPRQGAHLIVGPVNGGKSTTARAVLEWIKGLIRDVSGNRATAKTVTAEDPVERQEDHSQMEIDENLGITNASIVSHLVRMDYDAASIAEIKDAVTARAFFDAALAGRMVIGSFHALNAPVALIRLLDMDVKATTIQSGLSSVLYQRLVPRLCDGCKVIVMAAGPIRDQLRWLFEDKAPREIAARGNNPNCETCRGVGYNGLVPLFELLPMTQTVGKALCSGGGLDAIEDAARQDTIKQGVGWAPMAYSALDAVARQCVSEDCAREAITLR